MASIRGPLYGKALRSCPLFATDLASKALAKNPVSGESDIAPTPPLQSELTRIERALAHLRSFAEAVTYEMRQALLAHPFKVLEHNFSIYYALLHAVRVSPYLTLAEYGPEDEREHITRPVFQDSNTGPEDIRRWAHQSETSDKFVFSKAQRPLRK